MLSLGVVQQVKIYLDDIRKEPEGWVRTICVSQTIDLLKANKVTHLALDHDLGHPGYGLGIQVLDWIEEQVATTDYVPPEEITVHSANPEARRKMWKLVDRIERMVIDRAKQDCPPPAS